MGIGFVHSTDMVELNQKVFWDWEVQMLNWWEGIEKILLACHLINIDCPNPNPNQNENCICTFHRHGRVTEIKKCFVIGRYKCLIGEKELKKNC